MSGDLPTIGQPVLLRDENELTYGSRIEDIEDDVIVVARPADLRAAVEYVEGMVFDLVWTLATGIHVIPVELSATTTQNQLRLWELLVVGDSRIEQRREYVRAEFTGHIRLTPIDPEAPAEGTGPADGEKPAEPLDATMVDISEVATQCRVALPPDDPRIAGDALLRCQFSVQDHAFDVRGRVMITRDGDTSQQSRVVILFDASRSTADALRKQVFALQLTKRR